MNRNFKTECIKIINTSNLQLWKEVPSTLNTKTMRSNSSISGFR